MNREKVLSIFKDLERFLADLDSLHIASLKDLESKSNFYASSMLLFSIANRTIDLGEEIVASRKLGFPGKYREIFDLLLKDKVIDSKLHKDLLGLVYFRNLAAQEYHTFTAKDVFEAYIKLQCVTTFVEKAKKVFR